ncbi:hypothetical protein B0A55_08640 [Friedmanniomyces simplex]|uniref:Uncharacterized protein n=1 Tax=Friedmanniomyces simplex TaxID=329884 RepID=A0A4U0X051_9PEZI|nr:hypothetical protein B0A55_08640 [Friedmanniomyces simplex]
MAAPSIDRLLNLVPDHPEQVLTQLHSHPTLASQQDAHGYSLVHAATSYNHADLLRALIKDFHVDPNITDEDGETALFNAETVDMAKQLLELGVRLDLKNTDGQTAAERLDDEDEQPLVAAYLREAASHPTPEAAASVLSQTAGAEASSAAQAGTVNGDANGVHAPPPLPNGVKIEVGTMQQDEAGGEPDPEFRRRIEELAAREDFQTEEGQRELRNLVEDAVSGLTQEGQGAATRRRLG